MEIRHPTLQSWTLANNARHIRGDVRVKHCRAKFSSPNEKFNSLLSPDEKFRPIKVKMSLVEVQVNLRG